MAHSYMWRDSFIRESQWSQDCAANSAAVTLLIHTCDTLYPGTPHMCDMAHSYMWRDSFICESQWSQDCAANSAAVTLLIHTCDTLIVPRHAAVRAIHHDWCGDTWCGDT